MKITLLGLAACAWFSLMPAARADGYWRVESPDHEQTFSYGSEQNRVWTERGPDRHLAVLLQFTNDPFVDRDHPREVDNFTFAFPRVTLGKDGRTFYYHTPEGRRIPVAEKRKDFLGINEIKLLPTAGLIVNRVHGYLTLTLEISG